MGGVSNKASQTQHVPATAVASIPLDTPPEAAWPFVASAPERSAAHPGGSDERSGPWV